uniref:MmcQ/YjbR family DNA-binding protein n=1 Tax=uncultured Acinetobacter sp. TaxID=165433 RepID=UPI002602CB5D|nr:MmcQ/YjbR family DNA-binding protein [uncultured Acinetobacter sp.]
MKQFCHSLKCVEQKMPFDCQWLVFTVLGKMFYRKDSVDYQFINMKSDPDETMIFRKIYPEVTAGYHTNKRNWNSVNVLGLLSEDLLQEWIIHSYELVVGKLPKKVHKELSEQV